MLALAVKIQGLFSLTVDFQAVGSLHFDAYIFDVVFAGEYRNRQLELLASAYHSWSCGKNHQRFCNRRGLFSLAVSLAVARNYHRADRADVFRELDGVCLLAAIGGERSEEGYDGLKVVRLCRAAARTFTVTTD